MPLVIVITVFADKYKHDQTYTQTDEMRVL